MNANPKFIAAQAAVDAAAIAPLPNSRKIYVTGSRAVPCQTRARCITATCDCHAAASVQPATCTATLHHRYVRPRCNTPRCNAAT